MPGRAAQGLRSPACRVSALPPLARPVPRPMPGYARGTVRRHRGLLDICPTLWRSFLLSPAWRHPGMTGRWREDRKQVRCSMPPWTGQVWQRLVARPAMRPNGAAAGSLSRRHLCLRSKSSIHPGRRGYWTGIPPVRQAHLYRPPCTPAVWTALAARRSRSRKPVPAAICAGGSTGWCHLTQNPRACGTAQSGLRSMPL